MTTVTNPSAATLRSRVITFSRNLAAASGQVAYTGVGFRGTAIILIGTDNAQLVSVGVGDVQVATASIVRRYNSAIPEYSYRGATASELGIIWVTNSDYHEIDLVSFDNDGFTLNYTKVGAPTGTAVLAALVLAVQ